MASALYVQAEGKAFSICTFSFVNLCYNIWENCNEPLGNII